MLGFGKKKPKNTRYLLEQVMIAPSEINGAQDIPEETTQDEVEIITAKIMNIAQDTAVGQVTDEVGQVIDENTPPIKEEGFDQSVYSIRSGKIIPESVQKPVSHGANMPTLEEKQINFEEAKTELETIKWEIAALENNKNELQGQLDILKEEPEPEVTGLEISLVNSEKTQATAELFTNIAKLVSEYADIQVEKEDLEWKIAEINAKMEWIPETWSEKWDIWLIKKQSIATQKLEKIRDTLQREKDYRVAQRMIESATGGANAYKDEKIAYEKRTKRVEELESNIKTVSSFKDKWEQATMEALTEVRKIANQIEFEWDIQTENGLENLIKMLETRKWEIEHDIALYDEREAKLNEAHKAIDIYKYFEWEASVDWAKWELEVLQKAHKDAEEEKIKALLEPTETDNIARKERKERLVSKRKSRDEIQWEIKELEKERCIGLSGSKNMAHIVIELEPLVRTGKDVDINEVSHEATSNYLKQKLGTDVNPIAIFNIANLNGNLKKAKRDIDKNIAWVENRLHIAEQQLEQLKLTLSDEVKDRSEVVETKQSIENMESEQTIKIATAKEAINKKEEEIKKLHKGVEETIEELETKYKISLKTLLSQEIVLTQDEDEIQDELVLSMDDEVSERDDDASDIVKSILDM